MKLIEFTKICSVCKKRKAWHAFHKDKGCCFGISSKCKICKKIYQVKNKEKIKEYNKIYSMKNKDRMNAISKEYRDKNKDRIKIYNKKYNVNHKNETAIRARQRRKKSPKLRLKNSMSKSINRALKENKNGKSWKSLVGYSQDALKKHLEKQFTDGMTWENYGEWHIDHIVPISVFNFTKPEHIDFKRCWALSNLQPMWAKENIAKKNSLTKHFQPSLLL